MRAGAGERAGEEEHVGAARGAVGRCQAQVHGNARYADDDHRGKWIRHRGEDDRDEEGERERAVDGAVGGDQRPDQGQVEQAPGHEERLAPPAADDALGWQRPDERPADRAGDEERDQHGAPGLSPGPRDVSEPRDADDKGQADAGPDHRQTQPERRDIENRGRAVTHKW